MKVLIRITVVFGLIALLLVGVAFTLLDAAVIEAVERGGTYVLGTPTNLEEADVGIFSGEFELGTLAIANPPGFSDTPLVSVGHTRLVVDLASVRSDVFDVREFLSEGITLALERSSKGMNYEPLLERLKRFESDATKPPPPDDDKSDPASQRFRIERIVIRDVTVSVELLGVAQGLAKTRVQLPELIVTELGNHENGATIPQIASAIFEAVLKATVEVGGTTLSGDVLGNLRGTLEERFDTTVEDATNKVLDKAGKVLDERVGDDGARELLKKKLGGLLDKKKD